MPSESNIHPLGIVEEGGKYALDILRGEGYFPGMPLSEKEEAYIQDNAQKIRLRIKQIVQLLVNTAERAGVGFLTGNEKYKTMVRVKEYLDAGGNAELLTKQIRFYVRFIVVDHKRIKDDRIQTLREELARGGFPLEDSDIILLIRKGKHIIEENIIKRLTPELGYMQLRNNLWHSECKRELRGIFHTEAIYHMSIDLAELFMRRHIPRIEENGQKLKKLPTKRKEAAHV